MIHLSNGHSFKFAVAAGALGFDGYGYWWEKPLRWMGYIDPSKFTVISKTLTLHPRKGNLKWWCPWRCVRLIPGGAVNAVGLTNPGLIWWLDNIGKSGNHVPKLILSIAPETEEEAIEMGRLIAWYPELAIVGIEINASCPNTPKQYYVDRNLMPPPEGVYVEKITKIVKSIYNKVSYPLLLKLGATMPIVEIIKATKDRIQAYDLVNTIPWKVMFPDKPSPLAKYGLEGGVSGKEIAVRSAQVLHQIRKYFTNPPQILSGGGIMTKIEADIRSTLGADAISFGTLFLRKPWKPNQIVSEYERIVK